METKKFTVIDTRTGSVKSFDSQATTLRDLKAELAELGISTAGMSIQEGLTHIELINDDSILPHDVPWRGTITNNLVFRITQSEKKIASGSDRSDLYDAIKKLCLEDFVKEVFGKNFTQVSSEELKEFINSHSDKEDKPKETEEPACDECNCEKTALDKLTDAYKALVRVLNELDYLDEEDIARINELAGCNVRYLNEKREKGVYSDYELNEMFKNM